MVIFGSGSGRSTEFHIKCAPPVMLRVANAIEIESGGVVEGGCLTSESTSLKADRCSRVTRV